MKPTEDADRDPAFGRLIARGLERETDAAGHACPDADLLAAWFDRSLSAVEAGRIESHAAACASCQQILADLARSEPEVTRAAPLPLPARPWHWHWRWLVPVATAAVVVVVGTRTLRAPAPVSISAVPTPAIGDRPSTWVALPGLRGQAQPVAPPGSGAGSDEALRPAEPRLALRKEGEAAKALPAEVDRLAESKRETAALQQKPAQLAAAPAAPPSPAPAAAGSVVAAVPPQPAAVASADKARPDRPAVTAGNQAAVPPPPPAVPTDLARKLSSTARESQASLQTTSVPGPGGATVTWRYGQGGVIERSTDGSRSWERQASGVTTALAHGSAPSDRVCWIVGARGVVLRTTDGIAWQRVAPPTGADLVAVHASSDTNATVTASDHVEYVTTDGGRSWTRR